MSSLPHHSCSLADATRAGCYSLTPFALFVAHVCELLRLHSMLMSGAVLHIQMNCVL